MLHQISCTAGYWYSILAVRLFLGSAVQARIQPPVSTTDWQLRRKVHDKIGVFIILPSISCPVQIRWFSAAAYRRTTRSFPHAFRLIRSVPPGAARVCFNLLRHLHLHALNGRHHLLEQILLLVSLAHGRRHHGGKPRLWGRRCRPHQGPIGIRQRSGTNNCQGRPRLREGKRAFF